MNTLLFPYGIAEKIPVDKIKIIPDKKVIWYKRNSFLMSIFNRIDTDILHIFDDVSTEDIGEHVEITNDDRLMQYETTENLDTTVNKVYKLWRDRKYLSCFSGKLSDDREEILSKFRTTKLWKEYIILNSAMLDIDYFSFICDSKFVICPPGAVTRIYDALELGCIPLVYSKIPINNVPYPCSDSIDELCKFTKLSDAEINKLAIKCSLWWERCKFMIRKELIERLNITDEISVLINNVTSFIKLKRLLESVKINNSISNIPIILTLSSCNDRICRKIIEMTKFALPPEKKILKKRLRYLEKAKIIEPSNKQLKNNCGMRNIEFYNVYSMLDTMGAMYFKYTFHVNDSYILNNKFDIFSVISKIYKSLVYLSPKTGDGFKSCGFMDLPYIVEEEKERYILESEISPCVYEQDDKKDDEIETKGNFGEVLMEEFNRAMFKILQKFPSFLFENIPKETAVITFKNQVYDVLENVCKQELN